MLNVYFLRHGQTPYNADNNRYCGRTDIPLTEKGLAQAGLVAQQMKGIALDAVYSSPLERAYRTAVVAGGGREVIKDDRLIEGDFGEWEGKTREEFIKENAALWNAWSDDPGATRAGGIGETGQEIVNRVDDFFAWALRRHNGGNIMVVAHNGVNRLYLAHKLGMPLKAYRRIVQENSTVSLFQLDDNGDLILVHLNSKL